MTERLRQRILRLRPDWDAERISGFIYLEGGYSNDNFRFEYLGERYVLRAVAHHREFVDRRLEQRLYAEGAAAGMPEVAAFDPESGDLITRWVAGRMLADCDPGGPELIDYLRRLHRHIPPVERRYDPVVQARAHLSRISAPGWLVRLAARLHWTPPELVACHNDLNPWNVICTPDGRWITLDWEWVGRNDPLFDLVTLHQGAGLPDDELGVLAHRLLGEPPAPDRLGRCLTAFWLRETTWAMAEIEAGRDRPEIREQRRIGLERLERFSGAA